MLRVSVKTLPYFRDYFSKSSQKETGKEPSFFTVILRIILTAANLVNLQNTRPLICI